MSEENKQKFTEGKVIISSTEYRSLLEEIGKWKKDYAEIREQNSNDYWKANKLEKENEKLKKENESFKYFLKDKNLQDTYKLYLVDMQSKDEEDEEDE